MKIWGLLILVIDVLAIVDVWRQEPSMEKKLLWTIVIILLPLVGPLAWYLVSRRIINF